MIDFKTARIPWNLPPYPPYHTGNYIEEYFYNAYLSNKELFDKKGYTLIPIFWTTAYLNHINVQRFVNALPKGNKYFCVSQHDDAVKEQLPEGTVVFSAGGNSGGIPLPLVCSPIPTELIPLNPKQIFCSFVGAQTHDVRKIMFKSLSNNKLYTLQDIQWDWTVTSDKQKLYLDVLSKSKFTLCPRGYGAQSFRFYEALQLGSIPVYIHNDIKWTPYTDVLNWNEFCISIHINELNNLDDILTSIDDDKIVSMRQKGLEVYKKYFALNKMPQQILNRLK
jgi:Exostosin family